MLDSRWIAYVGPFRFPQGEAGSRRVYGIARSLQEAGHPVMVGSGESEPLTPILMHSGEQAGLSYLGLAEMPRRTSSIFAKALRWYITLGRRTVRWLDRQPTLPACIIIYGDYAPFVLRLQAWSRRRHVPLICDVVEWYNSSHVQGGPLGPSNVSAKTTLRLLYPRSDGIIAISSFLEDYYRRHGCRVLRVPPTLDVEHTIANFHVPSDRQGPLTLAYAGMMGKKDLMNNVLEAVLQLDPTGRQVRLVMAGPEKGVVLGMEALRSRGVNSLPGCIEVLGPQPHAQALELVRNADFMPLLRPPLRYAQAGFPTKVTESLAVGTPVICNLTSDLGDYIQDGCEGFVCANHSPSAFADALARALVLTPAQHAEMRRAARERALRSFDYRVYTQPLAGFLGEVQF